MPQRPGTTYGPTTRVRSPRGPEADDALPFLSAALGRFLEELPGARDGLSRTERQLLQVLADGPRSPVQAFLAAQELEDTPFHGDTSIFRALRELGRGESRLVETAAGAEVPESADAESVLTAAGCEVRTARPIVSRCSGSTAGSAARMWSPGAVWRWDAAHRSLVAPGSTGTHSAQRRFPCVTPRRAAWERCRLHRLRPAATRARRARAGARGRRALVRHQSGGAATTPLQVAPIRPQSAPRAAARPLVVDVVGAVREPGLYHLAAGARVADAVAQAGGLSRRADRRAVNLAALVADGQQVVVAARGSPGAAATSGSSPAAPGAPVSLSAASAEQLDTLPGIGPVTAQKIVTFRQEHGPFASVEGLDAIPGIGPARLAQLKGLVVP